MAKELSKTYDPSQIEDKRYGEWVERGYFTAKADPDKKPFTIVIPPPNVTGQLHMGHALDETTQDILIRYKRMQGYATLWLPGTDHAGIATQIKVEENLRKEEGLTRHDLGREEFLKRTWAWKEQYGNRIINQLKKLGSSCDWSRERFTMDEGFSRAVKKTFVDLYNKGLIYKGNRITNWCPHCVTALSDAEVEYKDSPGNFWHIRYAVKDSDEFLTVATTRPETMLGDTAIAVHPEDERYAHLVGKTVILPLVEREIPIVDDDYVEREFGTGAVKITPCHDPNDFEVGKRHNLEEIKVLDDHACVINGGKYNGLTREEARKQIVADLEAGGYLVKVEPINHNVGHCYRCGTAVEPLASEQWFVKMAPLAGPAMDVVKDGTIKFVPNRFSKIYLNWMENIHDWCISRQLWWGHRVPAYTCAACGEMIVSEEDVTVCPKCGCDHMTQDPDVLDTWFSSALWPFGTLGWPDKTEDLDYFYPTSTLVTAYDIIFFWVARMIFSGVEHTKQAPFDTVFIHGLVRDAQGRKMSKSLGNGIDPLEIIEQYGADALRFTLITGNSPGNDMRFSVEKIEAARNFANKMWNAARFTLMNLTIEEAGLPENPTNDDKWILSKYNDTVKAVTENLDKYELGTALANLYEFLWDYLCDWYIELVKPRLFESNPDPADRIDAQRTLSYVLSGTLQLLHPFMPFITEEIWQSLPHEGESIMISEWPKYDPALSFKKEQDDTDRVIALIRAIRNRRAEMNVPPSKKATVYIQTDYPDAFAGSEMSFMRLASAEKVVIGPIEGDGVMVVTDSAKAMIPMDQLIDREKELARLNKEKEKIQKEINMAQGKLGNAGFVAKAPAELVEKEKEKLARFKEALANLEESIAKLQ